MEPFEQDAIVIITEGPGEGVIGTVTYLEGVDPAVAVGVYDYQEDTLLEYIPVENLSLVQV